VPDAGNVTAVKGAGISTSTVSTISTDATNGNWTFVAEADNGAIPTGAFKYEYATTQTPVDNDYSTTVPGGVTVSLTNAGSSTHTINVTSSFTETYLHVKVSWVATFAVGLTVSDNSGTLNAASVQSDGYGVAKFTFTPTSPDGVNKNALIATGSGTYTSAVSTWNAAGYYDITFSGVTTAVTATVSYPPKVTASWTGADITKVAVSTDEKTSSPAIFQTDGTGEIGLTVTVGGAADDGKSVTVTGITPSTGVTYKTSKTNATTYVVTIAGITTQDVGFTLAYTTVPTVTITTITDATVTATSPAGQGNFTNGTAYETDGSGKMVLTAAVTAAAGKYVVVGGTDASYVTVTPVASGSGTSSYTLTVDLSDGANKTFTLAYATTKTITATFTTITTLAATSPTGNLGTGDAFSTDGTGKLTLTATTANTAGYGLFVTTEPTTGYATVGAITGGPTSWIIPITSITDNFSIGLAHARKVGTSIATTATLTEIKEDGYVASTETEYEFTVKLKDQVIPEGTWSITYGTGTNIPQKSSTVTTAPFFEVTQGTSPTADPYTIKVTGTADLAGFLSATGDVKFEVAYAIPDDAIKVEVKGQPATGTDADDVKITANSFYLLASDASYTFTATKGANLSNGSIKLYYVNSSGNEVEITETSTPVKYAVVNTYDYTITGIDVETAPNPLKIFAKYVYPVGLTIPTGTTTDPATTFYVVAGGTGTFYFNPGRTYNPNSEPVLTFDDTHKANATYTAGTYNATTGYPITVGGINDATARVTVAYVGVGAPFKVEEAKAADIGGDIDAASHPIDIITKEGNIEDGKFYVLVKPTVPRRKNALGTGSDGTYTWALSTTDKDSNGDLITTLTGIVVTVSTFTDENEQDTIYVSNVIYSNLTVKVQYQAPPLSVTLVERTGTDDLISEIVPNTSTTAVSLTDGTGVFKHTPVSDIVEGFTVKLIEQAANHSGGGKFSFVATAGGKVLVGLKYGTPTLKQEPAPAAANTDTYTITVEGLKYTGTEITVAYDTLPAKVVTPPTVDIVGDKLLGSETQAVAVAKASDEGEIVAYKNDDTWLGVTDEQKDAFVQKGTIIPGEKLATTLTIEPSEVSNSPRYVQLTFTGPLSIIPPLKVKDVWITSTKFKVVYVFESSTNSGLRTRAETDTWAEFDAVNEILYVHLVDMDVAVLGDAPSYAQLAPITVVNDAEKVGATIGQSEWAVTLYEHPINLIPDNGVPGTNYPGYFTLGGTYPTDGQLRYKIEGDAAWKPFYTSITNQEIERLANGELLFFAYANYQFVTDKDLDGELTEAYVKAKEQGLDGANGVGAYIYIYKPKTYATTGENPVVVPRPYSIVAATTNTVALGFSRTAGTTTTGEFTFKVTPAQVLPNGEFDFTFTKNNVEVSPKPVAVPSPPDIDGAVSVTITNIKVSDILITVIYKQGVGVTEVSTSKVWSYGKTVFISSNKAGVAKIYSITGQLVKTVNVNTGVTITELPTGIYLVNTADGKISKIVVN
jgi:hypothetical protein